ncbi:MAG: DUF2079 domain-containing protein, partial [Minisyncoccia bacterium]
MKNSIQSFNRLRSCIEGDPFVIIIVISFIAFSIYWSYISIMKFYSLDAYVFDLGLAMQKAWGFMLYPFNIYPNMILWLIFPLFIPKSFLLILIFQAIFITMGIFPLYGISKHLFKERLSSMLIALSYLFYPYLSGMYYFDFHYQALFPTLFLFGYYFLIKNKYKSSFVMFILAGITRYPYILFILLLSIVLLIENLYSMKYKKSDFQISRLKFSFSLFFISLIVLILFNPSNNLNIHSGLLANAHYSGGSLFNIIDNKIFVLTIIFFPFMGLPLFSKKFIILYLPFIYLLFFSNFWGYTFPIFLKLQYGPLIVSFLYLGTIDALSKIFNKKGNFTEKKKDHRLKTILKNKRLKIVSIILILLVLLDLTYTPYGPLNIYSETNFNINSVTSVNWTRFNDLEHIVNMIPKNDPYILIQNNLPEIFPIYNILPYENSTLTPALYTFLKNSTINNIYMKAPSGHVYRIKIDYVLLDVNSIWYTAKNGLSMYDISKLLYGSGKFGIMAE